jgi:hypothetical protein
MRGDPHAGATGEHPTPLGEGVDPASAHRELPSRETPTPATVAIVRFVRAVAARPREAAVLGLVMVVAIVAGYVLEGTGAAIFLGLLTGVVAAEWIVVRERHDRVRRGKGRIMW